MSASACSYASLELSLPSELGYEVIARDAVAAFARRLGLPSDRIEDLKTVLCEACINAMEHGNSLDPGLRVEIFCRVEDERLVVEVLDQGVRQYTAGATPLSIGEKVAGRGSLRGMGLILISQLCDEAGFVPWSGPGNRFRFAFHRQAGHSLPG
ncbi:MAG: ATP-binding protein [Oscillochloridaceae bacterium]|nr:ATP-binding protein [Chloroflexaceae bacterium]MDW8388492.1 ATP-binding protein [Oscillochloridaceae bacterium]